MLHILASHLKMTELLFREDLSSSSVSVDKQNKHQDSQLKMLMIRAPKYDLLLDQL